MTADNLMDLCIIGGGINGVGIAADAAGRGLQVTLCEQGDLAHATSSKSSKLIHGGLRYLEYYEFRLVKEALQEREVLLKKAPHLIHPLTFVMPYNPQLKPAWILRLGLFLYDHLGRRQVLPSSKSLDFLKHPAGEILKKTYRQGYSYADCWVDDARLVIANALQARHLGANILTHTRLVSALRHNNYWEIVLENLATAQSQTIYAKALINASGPWVEATLQQLGVAAKNHVTLVKGSHIVVPALHKENFAFILNNADNRVIFVIPFLNKYSLIGTTDVPFSEDINTAAITDSEIDYLLEAVNNYFAKPISREQILWTFAGVRPLHSELETNPSAITRDYTLELNTDAHQAPLLSVFGGKITTYRKLAEHALADLNRFFPHMKKPWTANTPLPGGDFPDSNFTAFYQQLCQAYPWLPPQLAMRYATNYGTCVTKLLMDTQHITDLGKHFGGGLYEREVAYLIEQEWAKTAEDILWRRTKLGLELSDEEVLALTKAIE